MAVAGGGGWEGGRRQTGGGRNSTNRQMPSFAGEIHSSRCPKRSTLTQSNPLPKDQRSIIHHRSQNSTFHPEIAPLSGRIPVCVQTIIWIDSLHKNTFLPHPPPIPQPISALHIIGFFCLCVAGGPGTHAVLLWGQLVRESRQLGSDSHASVAHIQLPRRLPGFNIDETCQESLCNREKSGRSDPKTR